MALSSLTIPNKLKIINSSIPSIPTIPLASSLTNITYNPVNDNTPLNNLHNTISIKPNDCSQKDVFSKRTLSDNQIKQLKLISQSSILQPHSTRNIERKIDNQMHSPTICLDNTRKNVSVEQFYEENQKTSQQFAELQVTLNDSIIPSSPPIQSSTLSFVPKPNYYFTNNDNENQIYRNEDIRKKHGAATTEHMNKLNQMYKNRIEIHAENSKYECDEKAANLVSKPATIYDTLGKTLLINFFNCADSIKKLLLHI